MLLKTSMNCVLFLYEIWEILTKGHRRYIMPLEKDKFCKMKDSRHGENRRKEKSQARGAFGFCVYAFYRKRNKPNVYFRNCGKRGRCKGTFYLYFKDKYDLRNKLIAYKSGVIIGKATQSMRKKAFADFTQEILFLVDHIIRQFQIDLSLLEFISKNLSWEILKNALLTETLEGGVDFRQMYLNMIGRSKLHFERPDIMLYLIVEVVNAVCYNTILYKNPVDIETMKPYLYNTIAGIIKNHSEK